LEFWRCIDRLKLQPKADIIEGYLCKFFDARAEYWIMDSAKLNDWLQVAGIFALVASLIFVGLQMKQAQEIALSQAFQSRTDSVVEMLVDSADNPLFVAAQVKQFNKPVETLSASERVAMRQYATALLFIYENLHYQYTQGFVPARRWQGSVETISQMLSGEIGIPIREIYMNNPNVWSDGFQEIVDDLIHEIDNGRDLD
jgi:hypothetical protein